MPLDRQDEIAQLRAELALALQTASDRERELRRYQAELEAANLRLQELATTDPLTSLANRRLFDVRLTVEFAQARRKGRALSIILMDADNFKRRNDLYGHDVGDATLKQFAALLLNSVRGGDLVVRYGGEEFVLLLPETDEVQAEQLASRIFATVRAASWPGEPLTLSAGIADLRADTLNQAQIISFADEALYAAKRAGKDRPMTYTHWQQKQQQP